ncbi:unnamed protein product [Gongylonema pulchrum]|uniref:39S ribosomal protein L50, mitochondrial n=1 Tax=Gongylonema pulchrum TaxID=637853 RepID=A0A183ESY7_9BILA|nr:unnamed protein product [Gongylonema pulchrum]
MIKHIYACILQALGSLFFIRDVTLPRVRQYDFVAKQFVRLEKVFDVRERDLMKCRMLRKAKFPKDFWPTDQPLNESKAAKYNLLASHFLISLGFRFRCLFLNHSRNT